MKTSAFLSLLLLAYTPSLAGIQDTKWECVDDVKSRVTCSAESLDPETNEILMECKTKHGEQSVLMAKGNARLNYIRNDRDRAKQRLFSTYPISGTYPLGFDTFGKDRDVETGFVLCKPARKF
jgi:hypothetical protein